MNAIEAIYENQENHRSYWTKLPLSLTLLRFVSSKWNKVLRRKTPYIIIITSAVMVGSVMKR